ncbi:family 10 glycosylhydrolase [Merdimmobilis hominis]|nr:family 10 glycosylhydrolase [Merdimmobilis hominis]MCD4836215.1 family 10 glycosylhydrolase [Merdimmobilis hominis]
MGKRMIAALLSCAILVSLAGCGQKPKEPEMVTSSGVLELRENSPSEEPEVDYEPESPSANEDLPLSPSSLAASSSQPEVSSSSQPAESSSGPASSAPSVVESSSSTVSSLAVSSSEPEKEPPQNNYQSTAVSGEVRAIWISYLDFNSLLKGRTQAQFTANIQGAFDNIKEMGLNTVFVQVRPYGDALYDSDYFPWSHTITGTEGVNPGYDPLAIMVKEAHARGLSIEAWINPYRVRHSGTTAALSSDNQAQKWLSAGSDSVVKTAVGIYYNPGSEEARQLIVDGVKEIVANYNVDGIHFDDYFYPTTDASFDSGTYAAYQNSGGTLSLADWRRENVNILVRQTYAAIKSINPSVKFGISPQGNMSNNYNVQYSDVAKWISTSGYVDYICPQVYFGFQNSTNPYDATVQKFNGMITAPGVDLYVGLAPYKIGTEDTWAGEGKNEWINGENILARMVGSARKNGHYKGFALYRYDSVFAPAAGVKAQVEAELSNLMDVLN